MVQPHERRNPPPASFAAAPTALIAFLALPAFSAPAGAADNGSEEGTVGLQEVVVTATKQARNLQEVPVTISAVTEEQIAARGLDNILDVTRTVPSIQFSSVDAGQRNGANITIRGIANSRFNDSLNDGTAALTTGFYVDEVAMMPVDPNLYDVNRVEILKGPQGTIFGQASMGGTVRVILNSPNLHNMAASADVSGGSMTSGGMVASGDAMLNVPVVDGVLAARVVGSYRYQGGWIDWYPPPLYSTAVAPRGVQSYPKITNANSGNTQSGRVELLWTPIEALKITPAFFSQSQVLNQGNVYDRNLNDGLIQNRYLKEQRNVSFSISSATVEYDFGPAQLTSVSAYSRRNYTGVQDLSYLVAGIAGFNPDGSIPSATDFNLNFNTSTFSQEVRLQGNQKLTELLGLDWIVGGDYTREARDNHIDSHLPLWNLNAEGTNTIPDGNVVTQRNQATYKNKAGFADLTFHIGNLSLAAGMRHFQQNQLTAGRLTGLLNGNKLTVTNYYVTNTGNSPRYNLSYKITPDIMAYFNYSEGFRIGGPTGYANTGASSPVCQPALAAAGLTGIGDQYKSDLIRNFEVGLKNQFRDGKTRANIAVYRMNWTDLQQSVQLSQYVSTCGAVVTTNIGAARSQGVEAELQNVFDNGASFGGSISYDDAHITQAPVGVAIKEGWPLAGVAKVTGNAYIGIERPIPNDLRGIARVDWSYRSSMVGPIYSNPANPLTYNHPYGNVNVRFGVARDWWTAYLYMNNVFNKIGELGASPAPGEGFTDRVSVTPPRTVGIRLSGNL